MRRFFACSLATVVLLHAVAALAQLPTQIASGLNQPVFVTSPANDTRLFVVERGGVIKQVVNGVATNWLNISGLVDTTGERGLLGLAFDPAFASNGRFYVNYIDATTKNTVVARYTVANPASGVPDPGSATTIITVTQPAGLSNHKAGWIGFRPGEPGNLYIATGDGGGGNDPGNNAQNLSSNLGKILRITPGASGGYTIPAGNPFAGATPGNDEIWAYGLRNPFRNSFDRLTGDFWIGDVGQSTREEINLEPAGTPGGRNYGWRPLEGAVDNPGVSDPAPPGATPPLFDYTRSAGDGSVIGGFVYRGGANPSLEGKYIFGDYNSGRMWTLEIVNGEPVRTQIPSPFGGFQLASFGEDGYGGLYVTGFDGGVYRIATGAPPSSVHAVPLGRPEYTLILGALLAGLAAATLRRRPVLR